MNIEFETDILEIIQRTHNVKSFRFRAKEDIPFKPGQFFFVTIKVDGIEKTKHFSFSNSPTEKGFFEFTKRITESSFSQVLDRLKPGERARLRMPYGHFTFEGEYKKIALLAGGIGITPMRSICKFIVDKMLSVDVILLYGNDKKEDIVFKDDFDKMSKANSNIHIVYTLTSQDIDRKRWQGRSGFINADMITEEIPDYKERVFYISGPPKMVLGIADILENTLSLAKEKIKIENFVGY